MEEKISFLRMQLKYNKENGQEHLYWAINLLRKGIWQNCSFYGEMIPCSNRATLKLPPDAWSILSGPLKANKSLNVLEKVEQK